MKHFLRPKNKGRMKNPDAVGKAGNLVCGDVMWIYVKFGKKKGELYIKDVKFETFGCVVAIANSSLLTQMVKGKTIKEVLKIKKDDIIKKFGKVPPIKIHCSVLALDALHSALYQYFKKHGMKIPKEVEASYKRSQKTLETIEKSIEIL